MLERRLRSAALFWTLQVGGWLAFGAALALPRVGIHPLSRGVLESLLAALLAWGALCFGVQYRQALRAERERAARAEARAHEARLEALRYQLNPHFLLNALNAVSTLVADARNDEARRMIARLGDFLRLTLEGGATAEVPLAEELEFASRYLDIERIRFGDRLTVRIEVEPEALAVRVPALLLQPLVENAVRHGIAPQAAGGQVTIEARCLGELLYLRVSDDGPGLSEASRPAGRGVGLSNTRSRLLQLYGPAHRFELERPLGGGLSVLMAIPRRRPGPASALLEAPAAGAA
ncbi:MAG TPA: histidine kinase [Longimicrobiales bacterium]|nr:histidine kinase [Longimicrobiales bacterium]